MRQALGGSYIPTVSLSAADLDIEEDNNSGGDSTSQVATKEPQSQRRRRQFVEESDQEHLGSVTFSSVDMIHASKQYTHFMFSLFHPTMF